MLFCMVYFVLLSYINLCLLLPVQLCHLTLWGGGQTSTLHHYCNNGFCVDLGRFFPSTDPGKYFQTEWLPLFCRVLNCMLHGRLGWLIILLLL